MVKNCVNCRVKMVKYARVKCPSLLTGSMKNVGKEKKPSLNQCQFVGDGKCRDRSVLSQILKYYFKIWPGR